MNKPKTYLLNIIFMVVILISLVHLLPNEQDHYTFSEMHLGEELSKQNHNVLYCLFLSPKESDREIMIEALKAYDNGSNDTFQQFFYVHQELQCPTVYLFHNGIIQYRKKLNTGINPNSLASIVNYINQRTTLQHKEDHQTLRTQFASIGPIHSLDTSPDDHIKKIVIAVIVVLIITLIVVLITKYSIDWAISSRLDLNLEKEIKKKEAVDSFIEYTTHRNDDILSHKAAEIEFS